MGEVKGVVMLSSPEMKEELRFKEQVRVEALWMLEASAPPQL